MTVNPINFIIVEAERIADFAVRMAGRSSKPLGAFTATFGLTSIVAAFVMQVVGAAIVIAPWGFAGFGVLALLLGLSWWAGATQLEHEAKERKAAKEREAKRRRRRKPTRKRKKAVRSSAGRSSRPKATL